MIKSVKVRTKRSSYAYTISIGAGLLSNAGTWAREVLDGGVRRVAVVSNRKVFKLYGAVLEAELRSVGANPVINLIGDGERFKNLRTLERTLSFLTRSGIGRTDAVVALGGGVVGDLAGFAAATYLRGISLVQVPTTLLAMIDSSVGGKTGINSVFGKNLIGAFHRPRGVLIDPETLLTLPPRELTAGFCEAIKHGVIGGNQLFHQTAEFLRNSRFSSSRLSFRKVADFDGLSALLAAQVAFKAKIVAGDETEDPERIDPGSRKILNFGHTFGHALEKVTNFRYLRHGEAVGHGIRFAAALSKNIGLLSKNSLNLLYDVVHRAGPLPSIRNIDPKGVFSSFRFDKKNLDGSIHWILLEEIGKPVIVPHSAISRSALDSAFREVSRF